MPLLRVRRLGERPGSKGNSDRLVAHARLAAGAGGIVAAFLLAPLLALFDAPAGLAAAGLALVAAGAAAAAIARGRTGALAAAALGVAGLHALLASVLAAFPRLAGGTPLDLLAGLLGLGGAVAITAPVAILALLATGMAVEAARMELDSAGNRGVPIHLPLRAERAEDLFLAPRPVAWALGFARCLGTGFASPGLLLFEAGREISGLAARARGRRRFAVHASLDPAALARAQAAIGDSARLECRRTVLPAAQNADLLVVEGPTEAAPQLARLLETSFLLEGAFAWSREASRIERRIASLAREAEEAVTIEARSALLEEAESIAHAVALRDLVEEERTLLLGWKTQSLALLLHRRLDEGAAGRASPLVVAPAPAILPDLSALVSAGGLGGSSDVVYMPYWILPVATEAGDVEVAVDATTRTIDPGAVLAALDARGPRLLLAAAGRFVPAARVEEAAEEASRAFADRGYVARSAGAFLVYAPFLPTRDGSVNLLTGEPAGALPALPRGALPAGTLVS